MRASSTVGFCAHQFYCIKRFGKRPAVDESLDSGISFRSRCAEQPTLVIEAG